MKEFKGLLSFIFFIFFFYSTTAQHLTLYVIPPPEPLDWSSPNHLLKSLMKNNFNPVKNKFKPFPRRAMGHVFVELVINQDTIVTGMAGDNWHNFYKAFLNKKEGLGVLFETYPGHLETTSSLQGELEMRAEKGKLGFIRYYLAEETLVYLKDYIDSFKYYGFDKKYNGLNKPLEGMGAGCSAFAMSFLELINAMDPIRSQEWIVEVQVPNKIIGAPLFERKVHPIKVLFSYKWATERHDHTHLFLFEPQLIYNWILNEHNSGMSSGNLINYKNSKGIIIDCIDYCLPNQSHYFLHSP